MNKVHLPKGVEKRFLKAIEYLEAKVYCCGERCSGVHMINEEEELEEIKQFISKELALQKKEMVRGIKTKKFPRGQRQWCIQCANRVCRFIEGKAIKAIK